MKPLFPSKVATEKIDLRKLLLARPLDVNVVDQLGNPGKVGMGSARQDRGRVLVDRVDIYRGNGSFDENGGDAELAPRGEPGHQVAKPMVKTGICKVRAVAERVEVEFEHDVDVFQDIAADIHTAVDEGIHFLPIPPAALARKRGPEPPGGVVPFGRHKEIADFVDSQLAVAECCRRQISQVRLGRTPVN